MHTEFCIVLDTCETGLGTTMQDVRPIPTRRDEADRTQFQLHVIYLTNREDSFFFFIICFFISNIKIKLTHDYIMQRFLILTCTSCMLR